MPACLLCRGSSGRVFLCMGLDDYRLYAVKVGVCVCVCVCAAAAASAGQVHIGLLSWLAG